MGLVGLLVCAGICGYMWVYVGMEGGVEWVQGVTATPVITQMGKHFLSLNNAITQKPLSFSLKEIKVILGL